MEQPWEHSLAQPREGNLVFGNQVSGNEARGVILTEMSVLNQMRLMLPKFSSVQFFTSFWELGSQFEP